MKVDRSSALGVWAGGASGLFHSSDGGATWAKVLDQTVTALEVSSDPQTVYAGVRFSLSGYSFVLRTRDGGATWTQIRQGGGSTVMTALATEFANPYRVVATTTFYCPSGLPPCTGSALYSSQDGGDTWLQRTVSSRNFSLGTPWLVSAPGTFYVASLQTLAHSEDGGSTWSNLNVTTPGTDIGYFEPYDFAVDQSDSSKVYVLNPVGLFVLRAEPALLSMGHGRFEARLTWRTSSGGGHGAGTLLTNDTGAFSFFTPNNLDLAIKVLDGRPSNGHFWVFGAALTDVEYDLEITDTTNGAVWRHHNPQGTLASYADTSAF
ncbi:MAG: hypothetical protein ABI682_12260 [Acidobacteriota bacterium]